MSHYTFILGAGASFESGCPLLRDFFGRARKLRHRGRFQSTQEYDAVEEFCDVLQRCNAKGRVDFSNIESVMSAIEMAKIMGGLGPMNPEQLMRVHQGLMTVIYETLMLSQSISCRWYKASIENANLRAECRVEGYSELAQLVKEMLRRDQNAKVTIITFNYDLGLEYALYRGDLAYTYSLGRGEVEPPIHVCKLHGSLNWFVESNGKSSHVGIIPIEEYDPAIEMPAAIAEVLKSNISTNAHDSSMRFVLPSGLFGKFAERTPLIVPPTDAKAEFRPTLNNVWRVAAAGIRKSIGIFVCGYSLPETDYFFRQFFSLAMASDTRVRHIWVGDPEANPEGRIREMLNVDLARSALQHKKVGAAAFYGEIRKLLDTTDGLL